MLDEPERFPHFVIGAADRRIRGVLSTPIRHDDDTIGTLNLYSRQPDGFDEQAQRVADVTAAEAATAIVTSQIYEQARQRRDELQAIHDDEAQISQAQGALMAVQRCSAEQAIGLLANAAEATGDDLIGVARRILDEVQRQPIDDARHQSNPGRRTDRRPVRLRRSASGRRQSTKPTGSASRAAARTSAVADR